MKRRRKIVVGPLLFVGMGILLLGFGVYRVTSSFGSLCGNTIVATELSPDQKLKAVLFERNCGATTGFSSQVSILRADEDLPNVGGNVFAANESRSTVPMFLGGPFVALHWHDVHTLVVKYYADADVRFKTDRLGDVDLVWLVKH